MMENVWGVMLLADVNKWQKNGQPNNLEVGFKKNEVTVYAPMSDFVLTEDEFI
jgi:hypothetical protein